MCEVMIMVPFLKILDVYGAHSWEISVVGFIRKKKTQNFPVSFLLSHISTNKQDVWLLPTLLALEAAYLMLLSSLITWTILKGQE